MRNVWFGLCCLGIFALLALFIYRPLLNPSPLPGTQTKAPPNPAPTAVSPATHRPLKVCSDLWMPYAGEAGAAYEGYFIDIMRQIYEPVGYRIDYQVVPWSNCVEQVRSGSFDALVATVFSQTPDLVFPESSLGLDQTDFYTLPGSTWRFTGKDSLGRIRLGVVQDYDYLEWLDLYVRRNANSGRLWFARGEFPLENLVAALQGGQIDAFVENTEVIQAYLKKHRGRVKLRSAGTVGPPARLFTAFSPRKADAEQLAAILDRKIDDMRASGVLRGILERYGLRDWRAGQAAAAAAGGDR